MKTCQEWSLKFDQYYNNIASNKAPGLNEYEKSVLLSDAQDSIVLSLCNGTLGKAFESTEEVTNYLAPLIRQETWEEKETHAETEKIKKIASPEFKVDDSSVVFSLPDDLFLRTYEQCFVDTDNCTNLPAIVLPVTQDELWRRRRSPFHRETANRVLRLAFDDAQVSEGKLSSTKYSELISSGTIKKYIVRYISRPEPIILTNLHQINQELDIRGKYEPKPCLLDEALHEAILAEAVRLAKAIWQS